MKLRIAALLLPCALALTACSSTPAANVDLGGRSLMWADGANAECEVPPFIKFHADGSLTGNSACNGLLGEWRVEGDKIDLSRMGGTKRMCGKALMKVERDFLSNAAKTVYVKIDGDNVLFLDAERKLVMTLVPEKPGSCK